MSEQRKIKRLDAAAVGSQTGPRIVLDTGQSPGTGLSSGRYVGGVLVALEEDYYLGSAAAGAAITWLPTPGWSVELGGDRGHRTFHNTEAIPPPISRPVDDQRLPIGAGPFARWRALAGTSGLQRDDARDESQSYLQRGFELFVSSTSIRPVGRNPAHHPVAVCWYKLDGLPGTKSARRPGCEAPRSRALRRPRARRPSLQELRSGYPRAVLEHQLHLPNFRTDNLSVSAGPTFRF